MNKDLTSTEDKSRESKTVAVSSRERPKRSGTRKPMTDPGRLKFPSIPGFRTYLCATDKTDHSHRLQAFKDNWWEPVLRREIYGSDCESPDEVVKVHDSAELTLMKLPEELALEDDAARKRDADAQLERVHGTAKGSMGNVSMNWEKVQH